MVRACTGMWCMVRSVWMYKVAYLGWHFHGSQLQPAHRTVEGELSRLLGKRARLMSRTDRGVSARGNVLVLDEKVPPLLREELAIWARAEVERVPRVKHRHYRYLFPGVPRSRLEWLRQFDGTHDFAAYTRARKGTVRTVRVRVGSGYVDFFSRGFLWNQVRRMVGRGATAPPEPLILMDIAFEQEPEWEVFGTLRSFEKRAAELMVRGRIMELIAAPPFQRGRRGTSSQ